MWMESQSERGVHANGPNSVHLPLRSESPPVELNSAGGRSRGNKICAFLCLRVYKPIRSHGDPNPCAGSVHLLGIGVATPCVPSLCRLCRLIFPMRALVALSFAGVLSAVFRGSWEGRSSSRRRSSCVKWPWPCSFSLTSAGPYSNRRSSRGSLKTHAGQSLFL